MKFERPRPRNEADDIGRIIVQVTLRSTKNRVHTKGNMIRSTTIANARVSEVFAAIEKALFGEEKTK